MQDVLGVTDRSGQPGSAGVDDSGVEAGAWMRFLAVPTLYSALARRYPLGSVEEEAEDASAPPGYSSYYFDFLSGSVALRLPAGAVLIPKPPSEAYVRSQVRACLWML
jgi:hypothetical protein